MVLAINVCYSLAFIARKKNPDTSNRKKEKKLNVHLGAYELWDSIDYNKAIEILTGYFMCLVTSSSSNSFQSLGTYYVHAHKYCIMQVH